MPPIINRYFIAQMFLTRLPVPAKLQYSDAELAASSALFPLVGTLVGALAALAYTLGSSVWSSPLAALLAITTAILITGAFHEDGLADSADGLGGAFELKRKLEIMRDSRIGSYGSVALILGILIKFQALLLVPAEIAPWVLIFAHTAARWTALPLIVYSPYVREHGSGKPFAASVSTGSLIAASVITVLVAAFCVGSQAITAGFAVLLFVLLAQYWLRQKLGGITGDTLGAVNFCSEALIYLAFAVQ